MTTRAGALFVLLLSAVSAWGQTACPEPSTTSSDPVAVDDVAYSTGGAMTIFVLLNDVAGTSGNNLLVTSAGPVDAQGAPCSGAVQVRGDGKAVMYAMPSTCVSHPENFSYSITDTGVPGSSATARVQVIPRATVTVTQTRCDGGNCTFFASSSIPNGIRRWVWTWGDGSPPTVQSINAYHQFPQNGTYVVTATAEYYSGEIAAGSFTKTVAFDHRLEWTFSALGRYVSLRPTYESIGTFEGGRLAGDTVLVRFSDNAADCSDACGPSDSDYIGVSCGTLYCQNINELYTRPGTFPIRLRATGIDGIVYDFLRYVTVENSIPVPDFTFTREFGHYYVFRPTVIDDDSDVQGSLFNYQWDFGDGEVLDSGSWNGPNDSAGHQFGTSGTYQVTLRVTDELGAAGFVTKPVTIVNEPPVAVMRFFCPMGRPCTFSATDSTDDANAIAAWNWTMGTIGQTSGTATEYSFPDGCHTVELRVEDEEGAIGTARQTVVVTSQQLAAPDRVVADAHSSTYERLTPVGSSLRNTTGNLNGILEPGEKVVVEPLIATTANAQPREELLFSVSTDSPSVAPVIENTFQTYDQSAGVTDCWRVPHGDNTRCLILGATANGARSTPHIDFRWTMTRTPGGSDGVPLRLHVGSSFSDVPVNAWYYGDVESILHAGLTAGCGGTQFCPETAIPRDQLAVWLLRAKHGAAYSPPACTTQPFNDVLCTAPFAAWIAQLKIQNITTGIVDQTYRPAAAATRAEIAAFIVKALLGGLEVPACSPDFIDIPCTGDPKSSHWAAAYVSELKRRGGTTGCGDGRFCPDQTVTRGVAATFFAKAFRLSVDVRVCPPGTPIYSSNAVTEEESK